MNGDDKKLQKDIANIQLKASVVIGFGTTLITVGIALILFTYSISPNLFGNNIPINSGSSIYIGVGMVAFGVGFLIGGISKAKSRLAKL